MKSQNKSIICTLLVAILLAIPLGSCASTTDTAVVEVTSPAIVEEPVVESIEEVVLPEETIEEIVETFDWQALYDDYIQKVTKEMGDNERINYVNYIYLNNDDIPEMVLSSEYIWEWEYSLICTIMDGEVVSEYMWSPNIWYIPETGVFSSMTYMFLEYCETLYSLTTTGFIAIGVTYEPSSLFYNKDIIDSTTGEAPLLPQGYNPYSYEEEYYDDYYNYEESTPSITTGMYVYYDDIWGVAEGTVKKINGDTLTVKWEYYYVGFSFAATKYELYDNNWLTKKYYTNKGQENTVHVQDTISINDVFTDGPFR